MIRIGLRDAKAHFHRLVMSIIAIALGVSFVVGSFCFRSMLNDQVTQLMGTNSDHDVYVRGTTEEQNDSSFATSGPISSGTSYNKIDTSLVTQIEQVKGIDNVSPPERTIGATLLDHDGNAVVTTGAPTLMISASSEHPWRAANFIAGTYATGEHEIALSQDAAKKAGLQVGDTTRLIVNGEPHTMKVSGVFTTQTAELGVLIILAQPALVNQLMQLQGEDTSKVDKIGVYGNRTTPLTVQKQHQLADRINKALPKDSKAHAVTGQSVRDEATKSTQESLGFVQPLILIFAVIALFVGAFIIANTFTMIVRDSMRGYALLRSVGASPAQVFFSVVIQALILGVIGSVLGVLLGWGPEQGRLPAVRFSNAFAYGSRRRLHGGRGGHGHRLRHSRAHRRHGTTHPGDERDDEPREAGDGTRLDRCRHGGVRSTVLVVVLAAGSQESLMGMAHHGGHGLAARLGRRMHGGWRDRARPGSGDRRRQGAGVAPLSHSR